MDSGNWSGQYSMENVVGCEYNMDNGYVEVYYFDVNVLRLKCEEIEASLHTTEQSFAKLHKLLDDKPIEYVAMALSGELQAYCDIEADMVKGMFGTIVQGYLKQDIVKLWRKRWQENFLDMKVEGNMTDTEKKVMVRLEDFDGNRFIRNGYGSAEFS